MSNESSSRSLKKASVERTIKITKHALTGMPVVRLHSAKYSGNKPSLPNDQTMRAVPIKFVKQDAVMPKMAQQ